MKREVLAGLAAVAALGAVAIAPPGAAAEAKQPKVTEQAKFKLSMHGEQTSTWRTDEVGQNPYGPPYSCHGEESEHVSFATPRPLRVTVKAVRIEAAVDVVDTEFLWFAFGPGGPRGLGDPTLKVQADVERRSARTGAQNCWVYIDGPDGPDPRENCARSAQELEWWLHLAPGISPRTGLVASDRIALWNDYNRDQPDPFPDCSGGVFPHMALTHYPGGTDVTGKVSPRELFDRDVKRITIRASDEHIDEDSGDEYGVEYYENYTDRISYTVSLKRIGKK